MSYPRKDITQVQEENARACIIPLWSSSLVLEAVNTVEKEDTHESSVDPSMNFL